ncbi:uracil-DNA glycosylase family protein [Marinobacterium litorale]|uniref:uracil-DNA glycosylase family protein n=1 Tax=Marinobacterium litorale TaxID=404770 RepID=UPI0003F8708D|nr:uracil-DNA glycosylase family protein [Marinobacterium litorale]
MKFDALLEQVQACTLCAQHLPFEPKPIFQAHPAARILIIGQAPGRKAHEAGVPFDDPSGQRLREWMGLTSTEFYDRKQVAILPMGFCFPGTGKSGDLPPRPECAPAWRDALMNHLTEVELTLVLGRFAQAYFFGDRGSSLTQRVAAWRDTWPQALPLPHPSPRNNLWLRRNRWFEDQVIPALQERVVQLLRIE